MTKLSIAELTLATCINNIENSWLVWELWVNMLKLFCSFRFGLKSAFYVTSKFVLTLYFCEPLLITVQENRSMRNIKQ